ncbi:MAG TPA: hypothetical protein VNV42_11530 [Solirubrobacteraceae bacterium]|jgi:hypothetical protein|nr:hypothetical protein [Solirubrobacteraceae bacterium]
MGAHVARASEPRALVMAGRAPWGIVTAAVGVVVWLLVDPRTPDLAAQVYRANLFSEAGLIVWDSRWYAGHPIPGYSLVFPPLGALLGVRTVGALAVLASAALFERVALVAYGGAARWAAVWFALAALGDVWSGRITFALGVSFALGAVLALMRRHAFAAALLAAVCAACSPVAGVLLALAALTHTVVTRSPRALLVLGVPAVAVAAALAGLFGEGGWEPFPLLSFIATAAVVVGFLVALPRKRGLLWVGGWVYAAACVACVAVHSPMGANVERYGVLLAGPLLLCAVLSGDRGAAVPSGGEDSEAPRTGERRPVAIAVVVAALAGIAVWTVWGPVRETAAVAGNPSTAAAYYAPVARYVAGVEARTGQPVRVEVPFTRSHWEAAWLAPKVMLARGWEKQLDERYDGVLLAKHLTAAAYRRWLDAEAIAYVALPDAPLDPSSAAEGRLIAAGLPYLRLVLHTRHWRIYAVRDPTPLARGPGALTGVGHDWFAIRARTAGRFVVRLRYTRYFTVVVGAGCVARGPGGFTEVSAARPGTLRVQARFSLARALGLAGRSCRA